MTPPIIRQRNGKIIKSAPLSQNGEAKTANSTPIIINITVVLDSLICAVSITETVPSGWVISGISGPGAGDARQRQDRR